MHVCDMASKPGIVIVSCSKTKPKSIIKLISKTQQINNSDEPTFTTHPWIIDTKYYTAEVNLLGIETDIHLDKDFISNVEALIIHMDSNSSSGLEDLQKWKFLDDDYNVDVKLLLANYCNDSTKITKNQALEWCIKRGFEFIELYPNIEKHDQEDIIVEKFGVDRIVEALQTHMWSNLVMKSKKNTKPSTKPSTIANTIVNENSDIGNTLSAEHIDDFTDLFSQLQTMKDSFQGMPMNQRKQCAEEMVTAFWNAIGGEEEELVDI